VIELYYFDSHCDFLRKKQNGGVTELTRASAERAGIKKSVLAVFEGIAHKREDVLSQLEIFNREQSVKEKYLALEGLSWVNDLNDIEAACKRKPLYATPVWNYKNSIGGSHREDCVLTDFGKCAVRELAENGILIDCSHSGERMFYSYFDVTDKVIASHSNAFDVHKHSRNLKKEQIKMLIKCNSYIGLTFYTDFVGSNNIEKLFEHIEYVLDMGGESVLGFGSDIDGCDTLVGGSGINAFCEIYGEMLKRNYSQDLIERITHGNFERVIGNNKSNEDTQ